MASTQNYDYNFPYFPPPPPHNFPSPPKVPPPPKSAPPHLPISPPPPHFPVAPPPPRHSRSPPTPAKPASHSTPPPPHPVYPPPPPPHIVPPPSPPGHHSTVIIVVFVSLGGLFFLALLSIALFCFIKKRKTKKVQETDNVKIDEHIKVREAIVPGPHGTQTVVLSIEEDIHFQEEIKKNETVGKGTHIKSTKDHPRALDMVASTSESNHHHLGHKS